MELEESIKLAVEGIGLDLYDIVNTKEHKINILRVYVTSKGGVNLDQCAHASRMISPILDIEEPMNGKYTLEVSSPGIERKLKSLNHFLGSIGDMVKLKDFTTNVVKGKIIDVTEDGNITMEVKDKNEFKISYSEVLSASTYFVWK